MCIVKAEREAVALRVSRLVERMLTVYACERGSGKFTEASQAARKARVGVADAAVAEVGAQRLAGGAGSALVVCSFASVHPPRLRLVSR